MGSDNDKHSRRNFGVTSRIWVILFCIIFVLTLAHYFLNPSTSPLLSQPVYSNSHLKPKDYFNVTNLGPNPFEFCPSGGEGDTLSEKYGANLISQSRSNVGSGARVQRVLNKALSGQAITISVIGGSISACHGAGDDPISPSCYPSKFFQWWNTIFPHPATELTNGAMRRTDSSYFGFCNSHHLPDITDLVIVELDTEDVPGEQAMEHFETLIRSILIRPDQPAVVILGHFSPQIHQSFGFTGADHWHNLVARFYDVPQISIKPVLYPQYMHNPDSMSDYFTDPILANPAGHDVLAEVLIAYFQSEICHAWDHAGGAVRAATGGEGGADTHGLFGGIGQRKGVPEPGKEKDAAKEEDDEDSDEKQKVPHYLTQIQVPNSRLNTKPNSGRRFEEISPFCVSANDLINPLPPSLFYGSGWYSSHPPNAGGSSLRSTAHYWYSTLAASKLRIPIQVGAGDIGVYYLKEPVSQVGEGSSVECWVDDNYAGAKVIENAADVGEPQPALTIIDHFVSRGSHFVECRLFGDEGQTVPMFKLLGIFST